MKFRQIEHDITPVAFNSLLIQWKFEKIDTETVRYLQAFKRYLDNEDHSDILYLTPAYDSLLVKFKINKIDVISKVKKYKDLLAKFSLEEDESDYYTTYEMPICYEKFGIDLDYISKEKNLDVHEVIHIHTNTVYTLHFIGFLPGFLYLGEIDKHIQIPRRETPRMKVEKGSVGIAENQTGIYPMDSPGGWQIVGRTPIDIFDAKKNKPSPFQPGDQIKFKPISLSKFESILQSKNPLKHLKTL